MNKFIFLLFAFVSCQNTRIATTKTDINDIIYILPNKVAQMLQENVIKNHADIYFYLRPDSSNYTIYSDYLFAGEKNNNYAEKTNRKLFVNGKFYPLVFESDLTFASVEKPKDILSRYASGDSVLGKREYFIFDGYFIKFSTGGSILDSGSLYINDKGGSKFLEIKRN